MNNRWDPCIHHRDELADEFIAKYFSDSDRKCLLICGAGFDPRATITAQKLSKAAGDKLKAILIREDRPRPEQSLLDNAESNEKTLKNLISNSVIHHVPIFSDDEKTVVAGRRIVQILHEYAMDDLTDVIVDLSALSIGVSFPIVRYLFSSADEKPTFPNVHLLVTTNPSVDGAVSAELMDQLQTIPGFGNELGTADGAEKPKLWLPQLGKRAVPALDLILRRLDFEEICPILPFPASNPRAVEDLVEDYKGQIAETWVVDDRDFLYAAEGDPLDLYRIILRVDSLRRATYAVEGGSMTVLSPLGTRAMALGALLSALERNLPIVYVEALRYKMQAVTSEETYGLIHLWLTGEAYPK